MLRSAVAFMCALAMMSPAAAFAGERYNRRDFNHTRTFQRVRTIDFYNRNRAFDRRDDRGWGRNERRDWERERYWRDRRYDRRDYWRDRDRTRIIIIPRISF